MRPALTGDPATLAAQAADALARGAGREGAGRAGA